MEKEIRNLDSTDCEIRVAPSGRKVEGYAIVFNKESRDLGGFREVIRPEAIKGVLEESDVLALLNHNIDKGVLARSTKLSGTLNLTVDNRGVAYSFDAPKTTLGDEVVEGIKRGDIRTSSFAFTVAQNGEVWSERAEGYLREIVKFNMIYDVSPVYREAYQDTSVALRSLDEIKKDTEHKEVEEESEAAESEAAKTTTEETEGKEDDYRMNDEDRLLEQRSNNLKFQQ